MHASRLLRIALLSLVCAASLPAQQRACGQSFSGNGASAELTQLARALRQKKPGKAYEQLKALAARNAKQEAGARAALALGYYDYTRGQHDAALRWFRQADADPLLREYAAYWTAMTRAAQGRMPQGLEQWQAFRRKYPESALMRSVVQESARAAMAAGKPGYAIEVLDAEPNVESTPALLLLRAQALGKVRQRERAAADYAIVYYQFPLSDEAKAAAGNLRALERSLGAKFPKISWQQRLARPEALLNANRAREARGELTKLLPGLSGTPRERAQLLIARCRIRERAKATVLAALSLSDPETDAERLYHLSQAYRSDGQEDKMLAAIAAVAERYPQSGWVEDALFAAGNYFWVKLDRARAVEFYQRVLERFPAGKNALAAHWRLAWAAYMDASPQAAVRLEEHLRRFSSSQYTVNALYWLGRSTERASDAARARGFYQKAVERFPQTYYGRRSQERLGALGVGSVEVADVLAVIPAAAPPPMLDAAIPPAAQQRRARAQALQSIGFDASAELEFRAAYAATGAPRLLMEAAQAANDAGCYGVGVTTARRAYPQLEARRLDEVPQEVWRAVYPLPFEGRIEENAVMAGVDPMLVAAIIRQESIFQAEAVSHAGAVGLMQVLPKTGKVLARRLKLRYSRSKLFQPEFNLRLGTVYLADLVNSFGSPEAALAAYNAGEHRVVAWQAGRTYSEPAEFVESIPFTETREYVQIVLRNAEIYRGLYRPGKSSGQGR